MAKHQESIESILGNLRAGVEVERSFRQLFERYYHRVHAYFSHQFPAEEALDLTQEAFFEIYQSIGSYSGKSSFESWLFGLLRNRVRNARRYAAAGKRAAREVPIDLQTSADDLSPDASHYSSDPAEDSLRLERGRKLEAAISDLPPQMRRVLLMKAYHGLTHQEVAEALDLSVNTVKSHLSQGRKKLYTVLQKQ